MSDQGFRQFPAPGYCVRLWMRGILIYGLLRGVATGASMEMGKAFDGVVAQSPWHLGIWTILSILVVSAVLVSIFARRRRELPLLQNLGVDPRLTYVVALAPAVLFELVLWTR